MSEDRHRRASEIFLAACELESDQRERFLEEACAGDSELRGEVESLLARDADASEALRPAVDGIGEAIRDELCEAPTPGLSQLETATEGDASISGEESFPRPFGRFHLIRRLGQGGMGVVYEAEDERLARRVALKTVKVAEHRRVVQERFLREARIAGTLDHPNLVPVYDYGTIEGTAYYTMPLVRGMTLGRALGYLHRRGTDDPPEYLTVPEDSRDRMSLILRWFSGALDGLAYAHDRGITHRDIKPSNLMLDADSGRLRIADFGLARAEHLTGLTRDGVMLGTVAYMAPEQVRGDQAAIDARTDVYSMGVSLYRALVDRLPYEADSTAAYLDKILDATPRTPRHQGVRLHRDLETILMKCLEKRRGHRYRSAHDLRDDLDRFRQHQPIAARPVGPAGRLLRWIQRRPAVATLVAVLLVAGSITGGLAWTNWQNAVVMGREQAVSRVTDGFRALGNADLPQALSFFSDAINSDPANLLARIGRAMTLREIGGSSSSASDVDLGQAFEDLAAADSLEPDLVSVHRLLADLHVLNGAADRARSEEQRAASLTAKDGTDFLVLANLAVSRGDCKEAVKLFNRALARDRGLYLAVIGRGDCYYELGDLPRAETDYRIATHLDPRQSWSASNLAMVLTEQERYEEALPEFERALTIDPGWADIHYNYATALSMVERWDEAEEHFRVALELDPDHAKTHNNLGNLLAVKELWNGAREHYREARRLEEARGEELDPDVLLEAYIGLCDVALNTDSLAEAGRVCREVVSMSPDDPIAHYNMAMYRMKSGDPAGALEALERDVELGDRDHEYLLEDPVFLPLHDNPGFRTLIRRMRKAAGDSSS